MTVLNWVAFLYCWLIKIDHCSLINNSEYIVTLFSLLSLGFPDNSKQLQGIKWNEKITRTKILEHEFKHELILVQDEFKFQYSNINALLPAQYQLEMFWDAHRIMSCQMKTDLPKSV